MTVGNCATYFCFVVCIAHPLSSFINISGSNNKFKLCMKIGDNIWKFFIGVVISIAATTLTSVIVTFATSTSKTEQETGRNMKSLLLYT